jgi:hypothetical protein
MMRRQALAIVAIAWAAVAATSPAATRAAAPQASPAAKQPSTTAARLTDVAWLAGQWRDDKDGEISEEIWSAPAGDSMMGMWRWVSAGAVKLYEFLTITQDEGGVVFRLRHFDRHGVGWEEKDRPITLQLTRWSDAEAVFEGQGTEGPLRISYRKDGPDGLVATLERGSRRDEFKLRRVRP